MSTQLFSQPWVDAWRERIDASDAYASAARDWQGAVGLVVETDDHEPLAILLKLDSGSCEDAQRVALDRLESAD